MCRWKLLGLQKNCRTNPTLLNYAKGLMLDYAKDLVAICCPLVNYISASAHMARHVALKALKFAHSNDVRISAINLL